MLRHQANIGQRHHVAVGGLRIELRFDGFEAEADPMPDPFTYMRFVNREILPQPVQHPQVCDRVDVAGNDLRQAAHMRPSQGVGREERRFGECLFEVLADSQRLA